MRKVLSLFLVLTMIVACTTSSFVTSYAGEPETILEVGDAHFYASDFTTGSEVFYGAYDTETHETTKKAESFTGAQWSLSVTKDAGVITSFNLTFFADCELTRYELDPSWSEEFDITVPYVIFSEMAYKLNIAVTSGANVYMHSKTTDVDGKWYNMNAGIYTPNSDVSVTLEEGCSLQIGDTVAEEDLDCEGKTPSHYYLFGKGIYTGGKINIQGAKDSELTIYDSGCGIYSSDAVDISGLLGLQIFDYGQEPACCINAKELQIQDAAVKLVSQTSKGISVAQDALFTDCDISIKSDGDCIYANHSRQWDATRSTVFSGVRLSADAKGDNALGITAEKLTISDSDIEINAGRNGIVADHYKPLIIENSTVDVTCAAGNAIEGGNGGAGIHIINSDIRARALGTGDDSGYGIDTYNYGFFIDDSTRLYLCGEFGALCPVQGGDFLDKLDQFVGSETLNNLEVSDAIQFDSMRVYKFVLASTGNLAKTISGGSVPYVLDDRTVNIGDKATEILTRFVNSYQNEVDFSDLDATIYFGMDTNAAPILYRSIGVTDADGISRGVPVADRSKGSLTLSAEYKYSDITGFASTKTNVYSGSNLQAAMNACTDKLTAAEKSAVLPRVLHQGSFDPYSGGCDGIAGEEVTGAYLWPFSTDEIRSTNIFGNHVLRGAVKEDLLALRSPGQSDNTIAYCLIGSYLYSRGDGIWGVAGDPVTDYTFGVYPVFNLDLSKIAMVSAFNKAPGTVIPYNGDWKLTLRDEARKDFTAEFSGINGTTLSVNYANAVASESGNERIALIITDSAQSTVSYYDSVACTTVSGTAQLTLPAAKLNDGDRVFIFNEQNNGDKKTDLTSPFMEVPISYHTHEFTYAASENKITATCSNADGNCTLPDGYKITLALSADGGTYDGTTEFPATTDDATVEFTSTTKTTANIEYWKGDDKFNTPPVNAGTYTAKLTLSDTATSAPIKNGDAVVTATKAFTVKKAAQTITAATPQNFVYLDTGKSVTATALDSAALSYAVKSGESVTVDSNTGALTIAKAGDTVITVTAAETDNYNSAAKDITVSIGKKELAKPTENTATFTYTGEKQTYTPVSFDPATMNISGNEQTDANETGYPVAVTLKDTDNYQWSTEGDCGFKWIIGKAQQPAPTISEVNEFTVTVDQADRNKDFEYCVDDAGSDESKQWLDLPKLGADGTFTLTGITEGEHTIYLRAKESKNYYASPSSYKEFTLNHYCVEYNANGGIGAPAAVVKNIPDTVEVAGLSTLKRAGYTATGWNTQPDGLGTSYSPEDTLSDGAVLYAQWAANDYTVQFDANGGTGEIESQNFVFDQEQTLSQNLFTREGYSFAGWSTNPKGSVQFADKQEVCNLANDGEIVLYAVWVQSTCQLTVTVDSPRSNDVDIKVIKGNSVFAEKTQSLSSSGTDYSGTAYISGLMNGVYNVIVTQQLTNPEKYESSIKSITISDADAEVFFTLTDGSVSAELVVKQGTPNVMVNGLNEEAQENKEDASDVQIKMNVAHQDECELPLTATADEKETQKAIKQIKSVAAKDVLDYMNITIDKINIINGDEQPPVRINTTTNIMEIAVSFDPTDKYDIQIYRYHDDRAEKFTKLSSRPSSRFVDGTFYVDEGNNLIFIYSKKFSTYAVGYDLTRNETPGRSSGSSNTDYPISINSTENGTVDLSAERSVSGKTILISLSPDPGFKVGKVLITDLSGKTVSLAELGGGRYSFTMPASAVTVHIMFEFISSAADCLRDETCPIDPFGDTENDYWWHDGVHYSIENGLMIGISKDEFVPLVDTSRAMIATILWRLSGSPVVNYQMTFEDVKENEWYTEAIRWAQSVEIVTGYDEKHFGPKDAITREQMMTIFCRYYGFRGFEILSDFDLSVFPDWKSVSPWAMEGVKWAVNMCVIQGNGDIIDPQTTCIRAQAACIVQRFCEMFNLLEN